MTLNELTVYQLEQKLLNSYILYKIKSNSIKGIAISDIDNYSLISSTGEEDIPPIPNQEKIRLKNELIANIKNSIRKYSQEIKRLLCKNIKDGNIDHIVRVTREIVEKYLLPELRIPLKILELSYYLIKSNLLLDLCKKYV